MALRLPLLGAQLMTGVSYQCQMALYQCERQFLGTPEF